MTILGALSKLSPSSAISGGTEIASNGGEIDFGSNSIARYRRRRTPIIIIINNQRGTGYQPQDMGAQGGDQPQQ